MTSFKTIAVITLILGLTACGPNSTSSNTATTIDTALLTDTTSPVILTTSPSDSSTGVAVHAPITATFSEALTTSTVTPATFTLNNGVTGTVTFSGTTAILKPSSNLAYSTNYTATITTGIKDSSGNALSSNYSWVFTTQSASINDTGISANQCYQAGSDVLVACNSPGGIALSNAQDGMVGYDANVSTNSNADGKLGFSFSSVPGGCVQDNVTGLMWEVKTADGGLRDWTKTYENTLPIIGGLVLPGQSTPPPAPSPNPTTAGDFIYAVNATNLCGYSDWRLPAVDELHSIVDYGVATAGPGIDATWFPNTQGNMYWTSTPYNPPGGMSFDNSWLINFIDGRYSTGNRSASHFVRLVRANTSQATPRYTISADGQEVADNRTSLVWRRCVEGMTFNGSTCAGTSVSYSQEEALQLAAVRTSSTGVAWRLPNIKEISSIADKSINNDPAIDTAAFPASPTAYFWSSTPYVGNSTAAWHVILGDGTVTWSSRIFGLKVRLVRSSQ